MKSYSFATHIFLVNGVSIGGYDEGDDVIDLDRYNPSASHVIGADGEMSVSLSADRSGRAIFRLMKTSDSNQFLSALIASQENAAFIPVTLLIKDLDGNLLGAGTQGYITKPAGVTAGTNVTSREWEIAVENLSLLDSSITL